MFHSSELLWQNPVFARKGGASVFRLTVELRAKMARRSCSFDWCGPADLSKGEGLLNAEELRKSRVFAEKADLHLCMPLRPKLQRHLHPDDFQKPLACSSACLVDAPRMASAGTRCTTLSRSSFPARRKPGRDTRGCGGICFLPRGSRLRLHDRAGSDD